jgi:flagellar hook assembly protein FlgD
MLNKVFGSICGTFGFVTDVPNGGRGSDYVNFMKVGGSVMRSGGSTVLLGVTRAERVRVRIYDVSGRLVRTLADRVFPPGEHSLTWDGADDGGRRVPRGVFFVNSSNQPGSRRVVVLNP